MARDSAHGTVREQVVAQVVADFGSKSVKRERPETWVTDRTGHMGYTSRFFAGREVWMLWKESSVMEERLRLVARLLDGG
jgi:hypothetical protein